jgi:hypothetical protein
MLDLLLPQRFDNAYRGHKLALWLFGLLVVAKAGIAFGSIFNGYEAARSADGIPLDTFPPAATQEIVTLFALLGLVHLMLVLLCVLALVRYRAMIPLMFAVLLLEYLARRLILLVAPVVTTGKPPGLFINLALLAVMIAGLLLSLWNRESRPAAT